MENNENKLDYLINYVNQCWENRQYYKDEQNKLVYWIGGAFTAAIIASGLLGALNNSNIKIQFEPYHAAAFHLVFIVAFYYYLYKQLNVELYEFLGELAEKKLKKLISNDELQLPAFHVVKGHFLGKYSTITKGRLLVTSANLLLIFLYLIVVTWPIWVVKFDDQKLTIDAKTIWPILLFIFLTSAGVVVYKIARANLLINFDELRKTLDLN